MKILMPALSLAKNGDWFSRKVIPSDVRDEYQRAHGVRQEERFRQPSSMPAGQAKAEFAEWVAEIERRISALRTSKAGGAQELSTRQVHVLAGRWYDWFVQQFEGITSVETFDFFYDQLQDIREAFGGLSSDDGEDQEPSPRHTALIRAKVSELSRLPTFLAQEELVLDHASQAALLDAMSPDLVAALTYLRRRAGGNYAPDDYRSKFPAPAHANPRGVKLAGWNAKDAFEAWVTERKPAAATVNRWRGVFDQSTRRRAVKVTIKGLFTVSNVDTKTPGGFTVRFEEVNGDRNITANLNDVVLAERYKNVIERATFSKKVIKVTLSARRIGDDYLDAKVLKASTPRTTGN